MAYLANRDIFVNGEMFAKDAEVPEFDGISALLASGTVRKGEPISEIEIKPAKRESKGKK